MNEIATQSLEGEDVNREIGDRLGETLDNPGSAG
jgi:hypothetical protein